MNKMRHGKLFDDTNIESSCQRKLQNEKKRMKKKIQSDLQLT